MIKGLTGGIALGQFGNVYIMSYVNMKAGEKIATEHHEYDHVSFLEKGQMRLTVEGRTVAYEGPQFVLVRQRQHHEMVALVDGTTWICINVICDGPNEDRPVPWSHDYMCHLRDPLEDAKLEDASVGT